MVVIPLPAVSSDVEKSGINFCGSVCLTDISVKTVLEFLGFKVLSAGTRRGGETVGRGGNNLRCGALTVGWYFEQCTVLILDQESYRGDRQHSPL